MGVHVRKVMDAYCAILTLCDYLLSDFVLYNLLLLDSRSLRKSSRVCVKLRRCAQTIIFQFAPSLLLKKRDDESPASLLSAISALLPHALQRKANGLQTYTFGDGRYGQLGHEFPDDADKEELLFRREPQCVKELVEKHVVQVAAGREHTVVLTAEGQVFTFGAGSCGRLGISMTEEVKKIVVQVAAGGQHTALLIDDGEVYTCGYGGYGQLGRGSRSSLFFPRRVETLRGQPVVQVSAGDNHTLALTGAGEVYAWGYEAYGQLGCVDENDTMHDRTLPCRVEALVHKRIVQVAAGHNYTAALTVDGEVFTCGDGSNGKLGYSTPTDNCASYKLRTVEALVGKCVVQIALGENHSAVITNNGEVFTFGGGTHGKLGHPHVTGCEDLEGLEDDEHVPRRVEALVGKHIVQVALGKAHSVALTDDGYVFTFGSSEYGELGHGESGYKNQTEPFFLWITWYVAARTWCKLQLVVRTQLCCASPDSVKA